MDMMGLNYRLVPWGNIGWAGGEREIIWGLGIFPFPLALFLPLRPKEKVNLAGQKGVGCPDIAASLLPGYLGCLYRHYGPAGETPAWGREVPRATEVFEAVKPGCESVQGECCSRNVACRSTDHPHQAEHPHDGPEQPVPPWDRDPLRPHALGRPHTGSDRRGPMGSPELSPPPRLRFSAGARIL